MTGDDASHIAEKTGTLGLRIALEVERSHELGTDWPVMIPLGMADRLRVDHEPVRFALKALVYWMILERSSGRSGFPRVRLVGWADGG
jgi:hypothetical protein